MIAAWERGWLGRDRVRSPVPFRPQPEPTGAPPLSRPWPGWRGQSPDPDRRRAGGDLKAGAGPQRRRPGRFTRQWPKAQRRPRPRCRPEARSSPRSSTKRRCAPVRRTLIPPAYRVRLPEALWVVRRSGRCDQPLAGNEVAGWIPAPDTSLSRVKWELKATGRPPPRWSSAPCHRALQPSARPPRRPRRVASPATGSTPATCPFTAAASRADRQGSCHPGLERRQPDRHPLHARVVDDRSWRQATAASA